MSERGSGLGDVSPVNMASLMSIGEDGGDLEPVQTLVTYLLIQYIGHRRDIRWHPGGTEAAQLPRPQLYT